MDHLKRRSLSRAVLLVYCCVSLAVVYGWAFGQESCLNWPPSQHLSRTCMHAPVLSLAGPEQRCHAVECSAMVSRAVLRVWRTSGALPRPTEKEAAEWRANICINESREHGIYRITLDCFDCQHVGGHSHWLRLKERCQNVENLE